MFCSKCGTPADDTQTYCSHCGAKLNSIAAPTPVYTAPVTVHTPGSGLAITSMILGIVALALFCLVYIAIPCAIIGVALGAIALYKAKKANASSGMAIAGIVCCCIVLSILIGVAAVVGSLAGSILIPYSKIQTTCTVLSLLEQL